MDGHTRSQSDCNLSNMSKSEEIQMYQNSMHYCQYLVMKWRKPVFFFCAWNGFLWAFCLNCRNVKRKIVYKRIVFVHSRINYAKCHRNSFRNFVNSIFSFGKFLWKVNWRSDKGGDNALWLNRQTNSIQRLC